MKEKKKFLVFGGYVECRDGDVHYVPPYRVARTIRFKSSYAEC